MNPKHYEYIEKEFGKLLHDIANHISGDFALDHEDCIQYLWVAVIDAINGFSKQNNGSNGSVDDFIESKEFGKYLKTVLWNCKNKLGHSIKDRYALQRDCYRITGDGVHSNNDDLEIVPIIDKSQSWVGTEELGFRDFIETLTSNEKKVVDSILENPECMMSSGKINTKAVADSSGLSTYVTNKTYQMIKEKLTTIIA